MSDYDEIQQERLQSAGRGAFILGFVLLAIGINGSILIYRGLLARFGIQLPFAGHEEGAAGLLMGFGVGAGAAFLIMGGRLRKGIEQAILFTRSAARRKREQVEEEQAEAVAAAAAAQTPMPAASPVGPGGFDFGNPAGEMTVDQSFIPTNQLLRMPSFNAIPRQMAPGQLGYLFILTGQSKGKILPLGPNSALVGRDPSCAILLNDNGVSNFHARFDIEGGRIFVTDSNSRNGTYVNNQKVKRLALGNGDMLAFSQTRCLLYLA